jgi:hypothetical protein
VAKRHPSNDRLISGKLRGKAARGGASASMVSVDGADYAWAYRHGWTVWGKRIQAISISVSLQPERTRELILDFSFEVDVEDGPPSAARVARALEAGIRAARQAGWIPESRGRAFRYEIAGA